ncbi:MAG: alpha/beta hydrolase family protein [Phycisphaerae bacterium]
MAMGQRVVIRDAAHPELVQDKNALAELGSEVSRDVDQQDIAWFDAARGRYVSARFFLPAVPDPASSFPIVLFSPDLGIAIDRYETLLTGWARYGYAVIAVISTAEPVHTPETLDVEQRRAARDYSKNEKEWQDRAKDIDIALARAREQADLSERLNFERVAVAGHGIGAHTALLCLLHEASKPLVQADGSIRAPQLRAGMLLSPPGEGMLNLNRDSWASLRTPVLTIVGGQGRGVLRQPLRAGTALFERSHAPDLFLLTIADARHENFSSAFAKGRSGMTPTVHELVTATTVMYLRAVVQEDAQARQWLLDGRIERLPSYRCRLAGKNVAIHPQLLQPLEPE